MALDICNHFLACWLGERAPPTRSLSLDLTGTQLPSPSVELTRPSSSSHPPNTATQTLHQTQRRRNPSSPLHPPNRHTPRLPHPQQQLHTTIPHHTHYPRSRLLLTLPHLTIRHRFRSMPFKQSRHRSHEFHLRELFPRAILQAFGPGDESAFLGGEESFGGEGGAERGFGGFGGGSGGNDPA